MGQHARSFGCEWAAEVPLRCLRCVRGVEGALRRVAQRHICIGAPNTLITIRSEGVNGTLTRIK